MLGVCQNSDFKEAEYPLFKSMCMGGERVHQCLIHSQKATFELLAIISVVMPYTFHPYFSCNLATF